MSNKNIKDLKLLNFKFFAKKLKLTQLNFNFIFHLQYLQTPAVYTITKKLLRYHYIYIGNGSLLHGVTFARRHFARLNFSRLHFCTTILLNNITFLR